jgi:macrophage erythroblast attacher
LNRLLVDYLLRQGYTKSARDLATEKNIEALVDVEEFESVGRIEKSLREERRVDLALVWCGENKANLKKINVSWELYGWK